MRIKNSPACLICGADESKIFFEKSYPEMPDSYKFIMHRCGRCGLFFNYPRVSQVTLSALYNNGYYFFHRRDQVEFRRIVSLYQRTVALIENQVHPRRVLEIGSAKGYLLSVLSRLGWDVQGIEISRSAAKFSRQKLNVPTYAGTLEEFVTHHPDEKYPLILAIDLLEHVIEPPSFLERVNQVLERNGLLIIDTPNGNSANIARYGNEWQGFNPFHLFIFSLESLSCLLNKYGFEIQKVFSHGNLQHDEAVIKIQHPNIIRERFKAIMRETQLMTLAKHLRRRLYEFQDTPHRYHYLCESILKIRTGQDYFSSNDSHGKFAKNCQGDNLVVIAKKIN